MNDRSGSSWTISSVLVSLLAVVGVTNLTTSRTATGPTPATAGAGGAPVAKPKADVPEPSDGVESLLTPYKLDDPEIQFRTLEPLVRFYAAKLKASGVARTPEKLVEAVVGGMGGDDVQFLIATVAHPVRSDTPFRYDDVMLAIQTAMRRGGYVLDTHQIPWKSQAKSWDRPIRAEMSIGLGGGGKLTGQWTVGGDDAGQHQPGVVVFRRYPREQSPRPGDTTQSLRVVLLVTNTPIAGVDPAMMMQALNLAARNSLARVRKDAKADPIRIIGPDFSGTPSSLARALDAWSDGMAEADLDRLPRPALKFITGTAQELMGRPLARDPELYELKMTSFTGRDYTAALVDFIGPDRPLAILTEESSGFGAAASTREGTRRENAYQFTFPLNISEIRRRYAESGASEEQSNLRTAERLRPSITEGSASSERIRQESPGVSVPGDEMRLIQTTREIRRLGIHDAIINASDVRDILFLTDFLRSHCPGLRMYCVGGDLALTQQGEMAHLRGLVVASAFPAFLEGQEWTRLARLDGKPLMKEYPPTTRVSLANQGGYAVYNATLAHLIEQEPAPERQESLVAGLVGYGSPVQASPTPPIWILAASQHGFFPVALSKVKPKAALWTPPGFTFVPRPTEAGIRLGQAAGWLWCFGVVSLGLLGLSIAYLLRYAFPKRSRAPDGPGRDPAGGEGEARPHDGAMREASRCVSELSRAGSWLDDHLGFVAIRRHEAGTPVDGRRRLRHALFFAMAWIGYVLLASPAGVLGSAGGIGGWWRPGLDLILVLTLSLLGLGLWASIHALLLGYFQPERRDDRILLGVVAALHIGFLTGAGVWLIGWGIPGLDGFRGPLYAIRAIALASGVSPLLPVLVALGGAAFLAVNRLRDAWVVRPFRGKWYGGPVPHGLGLGPTFFAESMARLHRDAQAFGFRWGHPAFAPQVVLGMIVGLVGLWIGHCCRARFFAVLEPPFVEGALGLGAVFLLAALALCLVQLRALRMAIEGVAECAASLPLGRVLGRLPRYVTRRFGNFLEAVQGELPAGGAEQDGARAGAGGVVLEPAYQQQADALLKAIYRAPLPAVPSASVRLATAAVAGKRGRFEVVLAGAPAGTGRLGTIEIDDPDAAANGRGRCTLRFPPEGGVGARGGTPPTRPIDLRLNAEQREELLEAYRAGGPVEGQARDLIVAASRAARGWVAELDAGHPTLDAGHLADLREALEKPCPERSGSLIARECCRLLRPFWETAPAARACDPPPGEDKERERAAGLADDAELGAYPNGDERKAVRRLLDAAEMFVAMEIARELNRFLSALWLRVTAVTVLAVLVLIYVNCYPFGPTARLLTIACGSLVLAAVATVRAIWMFHTDPFLTAVTGRADSSVFSRELFGRLFTFVGPLLVGLGTVLSFAASDILRALIGPWL